MSALSRFLYDVSSALFHGGGGQSDAPAAPTTAPDAADEQADVSRVHCDYEPYQFTPYHPSAEDVLAVKGELHEHCRIPLELIDAIIDLAEYWPHTSVRRLGELGDEHRIRSSDQENAFLLRSYPLGFIPRKEDPTQIALKDNRQYPTIEPKPWVESTESPNAVASDLAAHWSQNIRHSGSSPCRKIVFTIRSHDQGWGGGAVNRGSYNGSYTWFDVGKERLVAFNDRKVAPSIIMNYEDGGASEEEVIIERLGGVVSKINALPNFRLPALEEEEEEEEVPGKSVAAAPEPYVCTTRTLLPDVQRHTLGDREGKFYFNQALMPTPQCLQRNLTAERRATEYKITWSCDDGVDKDSVEAQQLESIGRGAESATGQYVRGLRVGDVVTLWGKTRFPGWVNVVEEVGIDVYWAV